MIHTIREYRSFIDSLTRRIRKTIASDEFVDDGNRALEWVLTELNSFDDEEVQEYIKKKRRRKT